MDYALWLLGRKRYTVSELRKKFARRRWKVGEEPNVREREEVMKRLQGLGYLDDAAYARSFIETRMKLRPKGIFALRQELVRKGVAKTIVQEILTETAIDEEALARDALTRRLRRPASFGTTKDRRQSRLQWEKMARFLASRGFSPDVIRRVLRDSVDLQQSM